MTTEQFTEVLSDRFEAGMKVTFGSMVIENSLWKEAMELSFHKDDRIAFRASYALEWAYFSHRELFVPHTDAFIDTFCRLTNPSAHRHYTKMLCDMMRRKMVILSSEQEQRVAEKTFDLLIDPSTRVAVKAWAMEILFDLSLRIEWVAEHFPDVVRQQAELSPSPGMANHCSKLLKRIRGASQYTE